jgi:O-antigen ligase
VRDTLYVVMEVVFFATLLALLCNRHPREEQQDLPRSMQWFIIVMAPVIILLTITRGNWVAFLSGLFVFFLLGHRLISFAHGVRVIGLLFVLLPVLIVILQLFVPEEFFQGRIANPDNVIGRFATWKATIQIALEAPIFGLGLNNLHGALGNMRVNFGDFENYNTPHNSFLSMFVELGAIGLLAYLAIVVSIIQNGLRLYREGRSVQDMWRGITVVAIMIAYQLPSLFASTFYITGLIHVYVYAFAGAIAGLYSSRQSASKSYVAAAARRRVSNQVAETAYTLSPTRARSR